MFSLNYIQGNTSTTLTLTSYMLEAVGSAGTYTLRDLWLHADLTATIGRAQRSVSLPVKAHGVVMLKLTPVNE